MNMLHVLPRLLPLALVLCFAPASAQVADVTKLSGIIAAAKKDSVQKIERLAALKFHKLINQYRISSGTDSLRWDDTLWLASRNHCIWMKTSGLLSHGETKGTTAFTGDSPGDRYNYVSKGQGRCSWSGENALYNYNDNGRTIDEIAGNMAEAALSQWQHSPGHNRNMLAAGSKVHGVAFMLGSDGRVWATDLFAYRYYADNNPAPVVTTRTNPAPANPVVITLPQTEAKKLPSASNKFVKLDLVKTSDEIAAALYEKSGGSGNRQSAMEKAAMNHANYMANTKKLSHEEKKGRRHYYGSNPGKRMMKASHGKYLFAKHRWDYTESLAMVEADAASMDIAALVNEIMTQLDAEHKISDEARKGYGVVIKRVKNRLTIYVVRMSAVRK